MPQPAPSSGPEPKPSQPPADTPPSGPDAATLRPAEEGAVFRALVDAGAEAMVAYSAEQRIRTMVSEAVAPQLQPFLLEMRQLRSAQERRFEQHERRFNEQDRRFDEQDRRFDEQDRKLDALAAAAVEHDRRLDALTEVVTKLTQTVAAHGEKLAEHDRKLDVVVTRLDGLKVLGQVILGTLALLTTALIAVFGFLFTS